VTQIMYQDCYNTAYQYFTKSSPLPTYFTVLDQSLFIIPKFIPYSMVPVREDRVRGGRARLGYLSSGLVTPLHVRKVSFG